MISACVESLTEHLGELKAFFDEHYEELSEHKGRHPLAPKYEEYLRRDAEGQVLFVALREDGALQGYFVGFVTWGLHYSTCLTLSPDIFYTLPKHRRGFPKGAIKMFREAEREARRRGVSLWTVGEKFKHQCGALFKFLGFEPFEIVHAKWLDG